MNLFITPAAKAAAERAAYRKNRSVSQLFEDFIRQEFAQHLPAEEAAPAVRATA